MPLYPPPPTGGGGGGMAIGGAVAGGTPTAVPYIDAGSNLAQDVPNLMWHDSNYTFFIGHSGTTTAAYYLNGVPGLYGVANASGTNWFEAGAGNTTTSGYLNFGTGDACLASVTNGYQNVGLGSRSLKFLTSGADNIAIGSDAMILNVLDTENIAIGQTALASLGNGGAGGGGNAQNVAIGSGSLGNIPQGQNNIAIGWKSLNGCTVNISNNTVIGAAAGFNVSSSTFSQNTLIGFQAGHNLNGSAQSNMWIGGYQGTTGAQYVETLAFSDERNPTAQLFDYGITTSVFTSAGGSVWSMGYNTHYSTPNGLHIYNYQDGVASTANYERGILDWTQTTNVFRLGSQAGGTGVVRQIAIDGFAKAGAPVAADLPVGTWGLIDDTSGGATWLCFNHGGTLRKVQLT